MKKMSEIMKEIGFNEEASYETKKAFVKNLIEQVNIQEGKNVVEFAEPKKEFKAGDHIQLAFNLDDDKEAI